MLDEDVPGPGSETEAAIGSQVSPFPQSEIFSQTEIERPACLEICRCRGHGKGAVAVIDSPTENQVDPREPRADIPTSRHIRRTSLQGKTWATGISRSHMASDILTGTDGQISRQSHVDAGNRYPVAESFEGTGDDDIPGCREADVPSRQGRVNPRELAACIDWVAHGFEIVHTHFDAWKFQAADTVADFALHGRLCVGPRVGLNSFASPGADLASLQVQLLCDDKVVDEGSGTNVLDGPLSALRIWVDAMLTQPHGWPINAGDVVTTGTITDAAPLAPGQRWSTRLSDTRLVNLHLSTNA